MKMWSGYLLFSALIVQIFGQSTNFDGPFLYKLTEPLEHGECPTWDNRNNILYFVDIHLGKLFSYNYSNKELQFTRVWGTIAPIIPSRADPNLLIVGVNRSVVALQWDRSSDTSTQKILLTLAQNKPNSRLNDGKADSEGRLWFGTMANDDNGIPNSGALFKITQNLTYPETMIAPVNVSNGCAWNEANDKFYYIDTPTLQIAQYDYESENGTISNKKIVFDLKENNLEAGPDGMTIDKDDNLWVALWGGGSVIKINPNTGKLLATYPIPAQYVTSVMWGGPLLDILFVTTSRITLNETEFKAQPGAGSVYALSNLGTNGLPVFEANIIDSIHLV